MSPAEWVNRATPRTIAFAAGAILILPALGIVLRNRLRRRLTPEELERQRRDLIHQAGKLGDGEIIDLDGDVLIYSYNVAGVGYTTSQDIAALRALIPSDRTLVLGPAAVKFLPRNPANSIVLCELWNGLGHSRDQT